MADEGFVLDDKIRQIAEAYALDAVDFARDGFAFRLDWSDGSIQQIEAILTRMHDEMASAQPTGDQILQFAKMFGSYVGEVFRKNHGGQWGMVTLGGDTFPGMQADNGGGRFWPWGRVRKRLLNGPEDNVWHYYQHLAEGESRDSPPRTEPPKPRRSWWSRLRGA
jgi:hypothetical protein